METVVRIEDFQQVTDVELVEVRATVVIKIFDGTLEAPSFIQPGELFWVNMIPMEGLNGLGAHHNGESFFVLPSQFSVPNS